jgi:hypothetical protein
MPWRHLVFPTEMSTLDPMVKCTTVEHHLNLMTATSDYVAKERMADKGEFVGVRKTLVQGMLTDGVRGIISSVKAEEQKQKTASTLVADTMGGASSAFCSESARVQALYRDYKVICREMMPDVGAPATLDFVEMPDAGAPATLDMEEMRETIMPPAPGVFSHLGQFINGSIWSPSDNGTQAGSRFDFSETDSS